MLLLIPRNTRSGLKCGITEGKKKLRTLLEKVTLTINFTDDDTVFLCERDAPVVKITFVDDDDDIHK